VILASLPGVIDPVGEDHPPREVGAVQALERATALGQRVKVAAQRGFLAGVDRRDRHERRGLAGDIAHRQSCTSARNAGHSAAKASGLMPRARCLNAVSFPSSSSADNTIVVVASGYAPQKWLATISWRLM
jgi:hypothetical protein